MTHWIIQITRRFKENLRHKFSPLTHGCVALSHLHVNMSVSPLTLSLETYLGAGMWIKYVSIRPMFFNKSIITQQQQWWWWCLTWSLSTRTVKSKEGESLLRWWPQSERKRFSSVQNSSAVLVVTIKTFYWEKANGSLHQTIQSMNSKLLFYTVKIYSKATEVALKYPNELLTWPDTMFKIRQPAEAWRKPSHFVS